MNEQKKHCTRVTHCLVIAYPSSRKDIIAAQSDIELNRLSLKGAMTRGASAWHTRTW